MSQFEVGDKVRCVDAINTSFLVKGGVFTVSSVGGDIDPLITLSGSPTLWRAHRFELTGRAPKPDAKSTPAFLDPILQPHHYSRFVIEPITFILANKLPFNIGNVVKYACRYDAKNGVEDLKKAKRYLDIQIEMLEREERIKNGEDARDVWKVMI